MERGLCPEMGGNRLNRSHDSTTPLRFIKHWYHIQCKVLITLKINNVMQYKNDFNRVYNLRLEWILSVSVNNLTF